MMVPLLLLSLFFSGFSRAAFDEAALKKLLVESKKKPVLIYTWSPAMPLSVLGLEDLLDAKGKPKFRLRPLLDVGADRAFAEKIVKQHGWPASVLERNASPTLRRRGALVHYPAYQFAKKGALAGPFVPGYRSPAAVNELARRYLR